MNLETNETIIKLSKLDIWGQLNQTQEECAELITAINKLRRSKTGSYESVQKEIADVIIMLTQCKLIMGINGINDIINEKLNRCEERLKHGKL